MVNFGKIERLLSKKGISMNKLSAEIGRSRQYLYGVRDGKMPAKESDIIKIARYLDTTVEYLTDQTDDPSNTPPEGFVETENMRWNPYYDEEAVSAALKLATRPQGQILFSALKTASDEDIKKTIAILKALKGEE